MSRLALAAATIALGAFGCHAHIQEVGDDASGCGSDGGSNNGDGGNGSDGSNTSTIDAPPDAMPCTSTLVYLDFDGVTLTQAATDGTMNQASWLPNATAVIPQFQPTSNTRTQVMAAIKKDLQLSLGGFPVDVVTARPAAGSYTLVAIGGSEATNVGFSSNFAAYAGYDCGNLIPNDVVWVTDSALLAPQDVADFIVGGIGLGVGLSGTTDVNNCLCSWGGTTCTPASTACTLSSSITSMAHCSGEAEPENQVAAFEHTFCE